MPVKTIIVAALVLAGLAFAWWDQVRLPRGLAETDRPSPPSVETGAPVPDASFTAIGGGTYTLRDFKGKTVILNFWASWCAPCAAEFPELLALAEREHGKTVLIALSVDDRPQDIERFIAGLPPAARQRTALDNVVMAHDPGKVIAQDVFQSVQYPETFIIGPDQTIRKKIAGFHDWRKGY